MLVEDEELLRQSLARHIDVLDNGYKVVCQAMDGQEALDALKQEDIHLIITDIRMPVMDGLTLARNIHQQYPHILTVILSGYADFQYAQEALRQGVFDYLLKPVTRESLESTLGKASLALQKYYELEEDTSMAGKDSQEIVDYVVLYIRNHYMDDIDFSDISSRMGFSSAYLTKQLHFLGTEKTCYRFTELITGLFILLIFMHCCFSCTKLKKVYKSFIDLSLCHT